MFAPIRYSFALVAAIALSAVSVAQTPELAEPEAPVAPAVEVAVETEAPVAEVPAEPEPAVEESVVVTTEAPADPETLSYVEAGPAGPVCCPIEVLDYRTTLSAKRAYRCYGPGVPVSVCVDNPADCTCTNFEVPLCVPACCTGAPQVCNATTGLLGRGKVDLVWDCGFTATVVFRVHGGAIVVYKG